MSSSEEVFLVSSFSVTLIWFFLLFEIYQTKYIRFQEGKDEEKVEYNKEQLFYSGGKLWNELHG